MFARFRTIENGVTTTINGRAAGRRAPDLTPDQRRSQDPETAFLEREAERNKALAGVEVDTAAQAVSDSEQASRRAAQVLGGQGRGAVGGGVFSRLRGRRGGTVLGGAMTGGLAAANRAKLADAKRAAIKTGYDSDIKTLGNVGGGAAVLRRMRNRKLVA